MNSINHAASRGPVDPIYPTGRGPAQPPPVYSPLHRTQEEVWEDQRFARTMENWRNDTRAAGSTRVPRASTECQPRVRHLADSTRTYGIDIFSETRNQRLMRLSLPAIALRLVTYYSSLVKRDRGKDSAKGNQVTNQQWMSEHYPSCCRQPVIEVTANGLRVPF